MQRLQKNLNRNLKNVALGDPGLLVSKLQIKIEKKFSVGIIPHYVDKANPMIQRLNEQIPDSIVIDVADNPEKCIEKITSCECIVSSAMHGLIVADSFCIPNRRLILSDEITGGNYKFDDYYSVFSQKNITAEPMDLRVEKLTTAKISETINKYKILKDEIESIQHNLLAVNPFLSKWKN